MRFDVHNIVLELILTAAAVFWWMSRTPNTTHNCKRKQNWYLIWPGIGPVFAPVNYPLESLLVNIASLSGTVLGDILRPSQAIFSVLLVLHDAWPLLFTLVSSTSATSPTSSSAIHHHHETSSHNNKDASSSSTTSSSSSPNYNRIPNRKNWMRVFYISTIFLFVYFFLYLVLGGDTNSEYEEEEKVVSHENYNSHKIQQQQQLHHDYEFSLTRTPSAPQNNNRVNSRSEERQQHNQRRNKKTSSSSSTSLGIGGLIIHYGAVISGYLAGFGALLVAARHAADFVNQAAYQEKLMNHYQHGSPTTTTAAQTADGSSSASTQMASPFAFHPPPQPQHDVLDSGAAAAGTSNALQHSALVFTYFVYGIMLLVDFSSLGESGPWLLYVSGSVFIEVVKHFWIFRIKSLNVDTIV